MNRNLWKHDELILAFNLYCKIPFSKIDKKNPLIIELANIIKRTPDAVAMKLSNFANLDPELKKLGIKGLYRGSKVDKLVWSEFHLNWEQLAFESELLLANKKGVTLEQEIELNENEIPLGLDKDRIIKTRVNQYFFRRSVLSTYENKCCITSINIPALLNASHIIPWSKDHKNRLNPQNGLCLNAIHDKAFDSGLITITPDFKVKISSKLKKNGQNETIEKLFLGYEDKSITLPNKFLPKVEFLYYHNENVFVK